MDMARTSVNVAGNCLATVVVARWEGTWAMGRADLAPGGRRSAGRGCLVRTWKPRDDQASSGSSGLPT
jgi:hypothetical protein